MQTTRRDVLSFASVGAAGAGRLALGACASTLRSQRAATRRPAWAARARPSRGRYLDLRTGKGNQMAYARIQGDTDWGKQKYFWFKGYVNARAARASASPTSSVPRASAPSA